jgi:hypothetical protein
MLKKIINKIYRTVKFTIYGLFWYTKDFFNYRSLLKNSGGGELKFFPRILDKDPASHTFDKHYVYMDRWAFKKVLEDKPAEHVDIGSSIRFLSMASSVTALKFVDIRPVHLDFDNFECIEGSILEMPFNDCSVNSLSCLHVAEHIGLGRYGDPLDPGGTKKACLELARVLAVGGKLYFALPVGRAATYFNAHRVHDPATIINYFKDLKLDAFHGVGDDGRFLKNVDWHNYQNSIYACGMFEFSKPL